MHTTRRDLLDDFLRFVGEPEDSDARDVAERLYNQALTTLWLARPWAVFISPVPFQLTLVADQARYALPDYVGRIGPGRVRNLSRAGASMSPLQPGERDDRYPAAGTSAEVSGLPERYDVSGYCGVHTQPLVTGEALEVVSSDAADTDIVVSIAGDDANGRWTRNQVTLTGTGVVAIGTWAFLDTLGKAYRASATPATALTSSRGTVTLQKSSDQTELQKLFAQEAAKEHAIFTVYPPPRSADVLAIPVIRKPKRAFNDADPLPDLWEPAVWEALLIAWQVNRGTLGLMAATQVPRPAFLDLVAYDNARQPRATAKGWRG